jgi:hypothetical protein
MTNSIVLSAVAFLLPIAGGAVGMASRGWLSSHHLSKDSTDVVKLACGLIATLVALVLGLLVSSGNSFRNEVENEYKQALVSISELDQRLVAYGPEADEARQLLRSILVANAKLRWPLDDFGPAKPLGQTIPAALLDLERQILKLRPASDEQKYFQAQALQLTASLVRIQRLIANQERSGNLPLPVLIAIILCSTAIFGSFGLYTNPNAVVWLSIGVAAAAVAGSVFLIIELNTPFTGLLQLSNAPIKALLASLAT